MPTPRGKQPKGWCSSFSVFFLVLINLILAVCGLAVMGGATYLLKNFGLFSDLLSRDAALYILSSGIILFIFSLLAVVGAITNHKRLLALYVLLLILLVGAQVATTIFTLDYLGVIAKVGEAAADNDVSSNSTTTSGDAREERINNFLLRSYHTCCILDVDLCGISPSDADYCTPVHTCSSPGAVLDKVCISEEEVVPVDQGVCTALSGFDRGGTHLVGAAESGACGGGDPAVFLEDFSGYLVDNLSIAGYASLGVCVLEFLLILFATFLIFGSRVRWEDGFYGGEGREEVMAIAVPEPVHVNHSSYSDVAESFRNSARLSRPNMRSLERIGSQGSLLPARGRANSVESHLSSIKRSEMQENPNVIDSVI